MRQAPYFGNEAAALLDMALAAAAKDDGVDASHARSEVLKAVRASLCVTPKSPLAWLSLTAKFIESAAANGCSVVEAAVGGPQVPRSAQEVSKPSLVCVCVCGCKFWCSLTQ